MKKIYHLKTCDTNKKILNQIKSALKQSQINFEDFTFQEIKTEPITVSQLEQMYNFTKSYEALFSKRAKKYRLLKDNNLTDNDFKQLLLEEYTFLKRPVIIINDAIFIGNSTKNIALLLQKINQL